MAYNIDSKVGLDLLIKSFYLNFNLAIKRDVISFNFSNHQICIQNFPLKTLT